MLASIFSAGTIAGSSPARAQEVVQALPSPDVERLNSALQRLARNTRDLSALIDAGNASMQLGDLDAAIGFFGRAQELSPGNPQVKMGMAAAFLRSERPIEALRLFAEAERAGASSSAVAGERGLAYDLVGNNSEAQASYRAALARSPDAELTRRLALSLAISGDRRGFEDTLRPLLDKRDFAAFRSRAFGLAILGEEKEAKDIAEAVMPEQLAERISPYLAYMGKLTKAQQAAAANLGIFPRAAQIGRDDPRIAQYAGTSGATRVAQADTRLTPSGQPLGTAQPAQKARQADTDRRRRRPDRTGARDERTRQLSNRLTRRDPPQKAAAPAKTAAATPPPAAIIAVPDPEPAAVIEQSPAAVLTGSRLAATAREQAETPAARPSIATARPIVLPPATTSTPAPTFDLARVPPPQTAAAAQPEPQPAPSMPAEKVSLAEAFAGFEQPNAPPPPSRTGAVDIRTIEIPREAPPKPAAKPAPTPEELHPSRFWVQVATGKDAAALKFDWRRFARKAPEQLGDFKPHVVTWGQANRLLAGPVKSRGEANTLISALKQAGVDSFAYTSPAGEEIKQIP